MIVCRAVSAIVDQQGSFLPFKLWDRKRVVIYDDCVLVHAIISSEGLKIKSDNV